MTREATKPFRIATEEDREAVRDGLEAEAVFPITLPEGQKVTGVEIGCEGCGEPIPKNDTRFRHQEPVPDTHVIEALGVCRSCRLLSRSTRRVMPDGRLQWQLDNGTWVESTFLQARPIPWWDLDRQIRRAARRLVRWCARALLQRLR